MQRLKEAQEDEKRMELERDQERTRGREEKAKLKLEHNRRIAEAEKRTRELIEKQRAIRLAPITVRLFSSLFIVMIANNLPSHWWRKNFSLLLASVWCFLYSLTLPLHFVCHLLRLSN